MYRYLRSFGDKLVGYTDTKVAIPWVRLSYKLNWAFFKFCLLPTILKKAKLSTITAVLKVNGSNEFVQGN